MTAIGAIFSHADVEVFLGRNPTNQVFDFLVTDVSGTFGIDFQVSRGKTVQGENVVEVIIVALSIFYAERMQPSPT